MNKSAFLATALATLVVSGCQQAPSADAAPSTLTAAPKAPSDAELVARGEYLIRTTGCNDCHTPDYGPRQGEVPTSEWLVGSPVGFKGPWGTTYASNLRLRLAEMDETQWLDFSAKLKTRPIMPDFAVRAMTADDRRAIYRFVRSLGPGGQPAPAFVPPGQPAQPPYFELVMPTPPAGAPAPAAASAADAAPKAPAQG
ncbi:c-type cytochrome [Aerolutibacter daejeonensis]|uniref:c-type cytochrome n=1 Tax=Aerolutibacter daejeonensis TaxID=346181 RepID=UPI000A71480D|nr:c-type cytochrome [Lysobacter daejeonensis]